MRAETRSRWRLRLLQPRLVGDGELALQLLELGHALAPDRALAALQRALHAAVLGGGVDALGRDRLPGLVVGRLRLRQLGLQRADRRLDALQLGLQLVALAQQRRLAALGAGDALLLLADAALALLHLRR